jgi:hypothetical protein
MSYQESECMKNDKRNGNKTPTFKVYLIIGKLLALTVACSSGTQENNTNEEPKLQQSQWWQTAAF